MNNEYIKKSDIALSDFNNFKLIHKLMEEISNISKEHGNILECGKDDLLRMNLAWVILREKMVFVEKPEEKEFSLLTRPIKSQNDVELERDYTLFSGSKIVVKCSSMWIPFNISTRRINRDNSLILKNVTNICKRNFENPLKKIRANDTPFEYLFDFEIINDYIDDNNHFHNSFYAYILEKIYTSIPYSIQFDFNKESFLNEVLHIYIQKNQNFDIVKGICDNEQRFLIKIERKIEND